MANNSLLNEYYYLCLQYKYSTKNCTNHGKRTENCKNGI